jgi:hypothetical protein
MRNFLIFHSAKEGTSALVSMLDNFDKISLLSGEPFDTHNCGPMLQEDFKDSLEMIFSDKPANLSALNDIYIKTAKKPLKPYDNSVANGFKLRFIAKIRKPGIVARYWPFKKRRERLKIRASRPSDKSNQKMLFDVIKKKKIVVFMAVRQDIFRWGLSRYHGDGSGKQGHLQFKLMSGEIKKKDIGKIHIDADRFEEELKVCEKLYAKKVKLITDMRAQGISVHPIRYEDFLTDKPALFKHILQLLEIDVSADEIQKAIDDGTDFQKVHSDDISDFVENHEEITEKFGHRFKAWR